MFGRNGVKWRRTRSTRVGAVLRRAPQGTFMRQGAQK